MHAFIFFKVVSRHMTLCSSYSHFRFPSVCKEIISITSAMQHEGTLLGMSLLQSIEADYHLIVIPIEDGNLYGTKPTNENGTDL